MDVSIITESVSVHMIHWSLRQMRIKCLSYVFLKTTAACYCISSSNTEQ